MSKLVNKEMIGEYLGMVFGDMDEGFVALRGLGEKGTDKEGVFRETFWIDVNDPHLTNKVTKHAERWAQHGIAAYVIPAAMKENGGGESDVLGFSSVVLDIDSGDANSKLKDAAGIIGKPSMVVESSPGKLHAYWQLSEYEDDIKAVANVRKSLAQACGGDESFFRAPQPIRIPGSAHQKDGVENQCKILAYNNKNEVHFMDVQDKLPKQAPTVADVLDFTNAQELLQPVSETLKTKVSEGEEGMQNRFNSFNQVCGYWLKLAELGTTDLEEAFDMVRGWVASNMSPPWPDERIRKEFNALNARHTAQVQQKSAIPNVSNEEGGLLAWAASNWTHGKPPQRQFLVKGLIPQGVPMAIVAEGGAGKTFAMLDLCVAISGYSQGDKWMGGELTDNCEGATAVLITAEDDKNELHIRIHSLDPKGKRFDIKERLIVLPLINVGGSFPIAQHDAHGNAEPSYKFKTLLDELKKLNNLKLLVIDTLNSTLHGEEISATVIQDWFRVAAGPICGEMGATLIVTHHIRKGEEIKGVEDMRAAVRGSTAIMNSVRGALGIWHAHDYTKRMASMGQTPKKGTCYRLAVIKANNPEMSSRVNTLLRVDSGQLVDVSAKDKQLESVGINIDEQYAWIVFAIKTAADDGHPFSKTGASGMYQRQADLPKRISRLSRNKVEEMIDHVMQSGQVVPANTANSKAHNRLDVPGGPFALASSGAELEQGAWAHIDWNDYYFDEDVNSIMLKGF